MSKIGGNNVEISKSQAVLTELYTDRQHEIEEMRSSRIGSPTGSRTDVNKFNQKQKYN